MPAFRELYVLQSVDLEADGRKRRLREIAEALSDRRALDVLAARLAEVSAAANALAERQREFDDAIAQLTERIGRAEARLYSGTVVNPRELQGLQADVAQLGRQRDAQELGLLEVLEELDPLEKERAETQARFTEERQAWGARQESLSSEQAVLEREVAELTTRRTGLAGALPPGELALYEQVRSRNAQGKATARVFNDMCESCRVGLPRRVVQDLRAAAHLLRCPNCALILILE
ncbi:MAG: hypothetical protein J4F32_03405 [Dehalococcoidia bacterium]|nr:hypothetical protein [Dehalococcoidia bacterium]